MNRHTRYAVADSFALAAVVLLWVDSGPVLALLVAAGLVAFEVWLTRLIGPRWSR